MIENDLKCKVNQINFYYFKIIEAIQIEVEVLGVLNSMNTILRIQLLKIVVDRINLNRFIEDN